MGLIGSFLGGAAPGMMEVGKQMADYSSRSTLMKEEAAIRAEAEARLHERGRGEQQADYETKKADEISAEGRRFENEKGLISARRDPSESKLNALKLQQAESDVKIPSAVKMEYDTLKKNNEIISSSLYKAQAEGTYNPETASKAEATMGANTKRMSELLRPHLGESAPKIDAPTQSDVSYRYENGKLIAVGAAKSAPQKEGEKESGQANQPTDSETAAQQQAYASSEKSKSDRFSKLQEKFQQDMKNVQSIRDENVKMQAEEALKKAARERGLNV